jgi:hypothetical protein
MSSQQQEPQSAASVARSEPAALTQPDSASVRTKVVGVRLTETEYDALAAVAAVQGVSIPEVLRLSWFLIERLETSHA